MRFAAKTRRRNTVERPVQSAGGYRLADPAGAEYTAAAFAVLGRLLVGHWAWPEWVYLPGIFLGLAAGAQNFWVFAKERMDRAKKDKNHRVGFNSHQ